VPARSISLVRLVTPKGFVRQEKGRGAGYLTSVAPPPIVPPRVVVGLANYYARSSPSPNLTNRGSDATHNDPITGVSPAVAVVPGHGGRWHSPHSPPMSRAPRGSTRRVSWRQPPSSAELQQLVLL
jgi:hypothetical protein